MRKVLKVMGGLLLASGASLAQAAEVDSGNTLRLYNWTDYIGETTLADFEKATGIKVMVDYFNSNEEIRERLDPASYSCIWKCQQNAVAFFYIKPGLASTG